MDAMEVAKKAESSISQHEAVCAERWAAIRETMTEMKASISTLNKMMLGVMIAVAGWALVQLYGNVAHPVPTGTSAQYVRDK